MVVSQEALDEFLNAKLPKEPDYKRMRRREVTEAILEKTELPSLDLKGPKRYAHQIRGLASALVKEQSFLYLGMRMGKTAIAYDWVTLLRRSGKWKGRGIVIVPTPLIVSEWEKQAAYYTHLKVKGIYSTSLSEFIDATETNAKLIIVAWTSLQHMCCSRQPVLKRGWKQPRNMMVPDRRVLNEMSACFDLAAIDEVHACQNKSSLRFNIGDILVQNARWRLALTGTPFGRDPFSVWTQAKLIDEGRTFTNNYYFFEKVFGMKKRNPFVPGGFEIVFDTDKTRQFRRKLKTISIAYKLSEVRDIHIKSVETNIKLIKEQKTEYNRVLEGVRNRKKIDDCAVEVVIDKLKMISSGYMPYVDEQGNKTFVRFPTHAKKEWFKNQVEGGMFNNQVIMFHWYTETGRVICDMLKNAKISHVWVYGHTKNKTAEVAKFQRGEVKVIVLNVKTGSEGIDLAMADYLVYYEQAKSSTMRSQSEARPLGPARGNKMLIVEDILTSPVEVKALKLVKEGIEMLDKTIHYGVGEAMYQQLRAD